MKRNLEKVMKRVLALIICISTSLSSFTSYASGVAGNVGNNNTTSGPVGTGGDLGVDDLGIKSRTGLRFSLVDSTNPEKIVSVNTSGEPTVIDLWFMNADYFTRFTTGNTITNLLPERYFSAVKTQSINTVNNYQFYTWTDVAGLGIFDDIKNWIAYDKSKKAFVATGKDFQSWEEAIVNVNINGEQVPSHYGHIIRMLNEWKDKEGNLVFGTLESRQAGKTVTDITIPSNKEWKLLIEPLTMFTPCYVGESRPVTTKVAGTLSNIAEFWQTNENLSYLESQYGVASHLNWRFFNKAAVHSLAVIETQRDLVIDKEKLIYENNKLTGIIVTIKEVFINNNVATFKDGRYLSKPNLSKLPTMAELASLNAWNNNVKSGFAVNVFSLDGIMRSDGTHTWNSIKYPDGEPGEAPDSKFISDEENYVKVVKYYEDSKDAGNTYETVGIYGKDKCLHTVTIEDEPQYKVKEFFFSTDEDSYIETGTEPSYSEQKSVYDDVKIKGTGACSIEIEKPVKVLHILYQKENKNDIPENVANQNMILYQNEISRPYDLSILTDDKKLFSLYEVFPDKSGLEKTCHSSHDLDDDCRGNSEDGYWCDAHHTRPAYSHQVDGAYNLSVSDTYDYNSQTSFIRDLVTSGTSVSGSLSLSGGETEHFSPNSNYIFYRNWQKDKVTLYPEKNSNEIKNRLKDFSISSEAYKPAGTRAAKTSSSNTGSTFKDNFATHFVDTTSDRQFSFDYECDYGHNFDEKTYESDQRMFLNSLNQGYSKEGNALTEVYVGETNQGLNKPSDVRTDSFISKFTANQSYSSSESDLKFYPAVKMELLEKDGVKEVYVTSENLSTMKVFNSLQFGVYKKNSVNANLSSTQWSTHARSLSFLKSKEIDDKKSVLPGGAILDIDLGNKGDFVVGLRTYQACLPDEQVKKVADGTSFSTSLSQAKEQSNQLYEDVKQSLEGYGLEMYVYEGVTTSHKDLQHDGKKVHSGDTIKLNSKSVKTSKDEKYYLRHDGDIEKSNRANFDVLDSKVLSQIVYTIKSDAEGNVILYKDDKEIARASKTQDSSVMLSNGEIKQLDDNTKLITNYFSAIDRNKGLTKEKQHWYNEMFEGVSVLVTDSTYTIGFNEDSAIRSTVLDTKLLGAASSKSDLYSFDEEDIRSLAFYTTENTTTAREPNKSKGYVATLAGYGAMKPTILYIGNVKGFAYTKIFYINNFSVSDLN